MDWRSARPQAEVKRTLWGADLQLDLLAGLCSKQAEGSLMALRGTNHAGRAGGAPSGAIIWPAPGLRGVVPRPAAWSASLDHGGR